MGHARPRVPSLRCPHCKGKTVARSSKDITATCRELYYRCQDDECRHAFVAQLAILHTVRASDRPDPDVHLPLRVAAWIKAAAGTPLPANDDGANELADLLEQLP